MAQTRRRPIRYVVVVHGIGEQRRNETVLPVINRFAEARGGREFGDPLTLGNLASQVRDEPWIELEEIPREPPADGGSGRPFVGRRALLPQGDNIRFVDLHWADVMDRQFDDVGQPLDTWTRSMIDRLSSRFAPDWVVDLLVHMRAGVLPLQKLLSLKLPGLSDTIFNRFLGDVQLYGEYGSTRGKGVRRFHELLAELHANHERNFSKLLPPAYTIIAHSLGSIMAFDSLVFAHGARLQSGALDLQACPVAGYAGEHEKDADLPRLEWTDHVDSFVTLGSPIDKFLILWWLNYHHLADTGWMDPERLALRAKQPIHQFNYCDEQDPVGHELDAAYSSAPVQRIFGAEPAEEVIFARYGRPGVAHVGYWTDVDLFKRILDRAIDGKDAAEARPVQWFRLGAYLRTLFWAYLLVPMIGWFVATFTMIRLVNSPDWTASVPLGVVSVAALMATMWLMTLMIQWRQVLVNKRRHSKFVLPNKMRLQRATARWGIRILITALPFVLGVGVFRSFRRLFGLKATPLGETGDGTIEFSTCMVGWLNPILEDNDLLGWIAPALCAAQERDVAGAMVVGTSFAFILAAWNFVVFYRMKLKWGRMEMQLDYPEYLAKDPTLPTSDLA